ncbi:hypothetical protein CsSME_00014521 [Camellia sinensis var. sinensis]
MAALENRLSNQFIPLHVLFVFVMSLAFVFSSNSTAYVSSATSNVGEEQTEAMALLMWKASLDNHSQSLLSSWNASSHCNWVGIGCNKAGRVTHIDLESYGFRGTLSNLSFISFHHLLGLKLYNNSIYDTIPSQIGSLSRLTNLSLSNNHLSESIPQEVGLLRSLIELDFSENNLTGSIPSSVGNLGNLTFLSLRGNQLSGSIPKEVGLLRSLSKLGLYYNNLMGSIPFSIGNLGNLAMLFPYKN